MPSTRVPGSNPPSSQFSIAAPPSQEMSKTPSLQIGDLKCQSQIQDSGNVYENTSSVRWGRLPGHARGPSENPHQAPRTGICVLPSVEYHPGVGVLASHLEGLNSFAVGPQ